MRIAIIAAALAASAAPLPALAQETREADMSALTQSLADPVLQDQAAGMASLLMSVLLEMPVAPLMQATAEMAGEDPEAIDPDLRLADLAGEDAGRIPGELAQHVPKMMGAMGTMAGAFEKMLPQMREMAETMSKSMPQDLSAKQ